MGNIFKGFIVLFTLSLFIWPLFNTKKNYLINLDEIVSEKINVFNKQTKEEINYIGSINIPKINLNEYLIDKSDKYNNVDYNIQILKEADMPDQENGNFILASHSGNSNVSFFKNIHELSKSDIININYNGIIYQYSVNNYYEIEKTGKADIIRDITQNTLTLITCIDGTNKQLIIIAYLDKRVVLTSLFWYNNNVM